MIDEMIVYNSVVLVPYHQEEARRMGAGVDISLYGVGLEPKHHLAVYPATFGVVVTLDRSGAKDIPYIQQVFTLAH